MSGDETNVDPSMDAPDSPIDPRIGTTALAHEGGPLLAGDVNALNHPGTSGHVHGPP